MDELSVNEIEILKSKMPKGYYPEILKRSGLSNGTLNRFFRADIYREDIHKIILDLIDEYESEKRQLVERTKAHTTVST